MKKIFWICAFKNLNLLSHAGHQALNALIHGQEWVLAQNRSLGLVIQLKVHPIHREISVFFLGAPHKITAQFGAGGLGRDLLGRKNVNVPRNSIH